MKTIESSNQLKQRSVQTNQTSQCICQKGSTLAVKFVLTIRGGGRGAKINPVRAANERQTRVVILVTRDDAVVAVFA